MSARLVVLVSGAGTNLQALLDACADPAYGARVVGVAADRTDAGGLERAAKAGIPCVVVRVGDHESRQGWDEALTEAVAAFDPAFVVSAGFMKILGPAFLRRFTVINTHPALLPAFPGTGAVREALDYGVKVTGCTVHLVDSGVDTGPVIDQRTVPVRQDDDEDTLHERIKDVERRLLTDVVAGIVRGGWKVDGRRFSWRNADEPPADWSDDVARYGRDGR